MDLRDKSGLLIDDMPEMRNSMRLQLANAGLERCDQARNIKEAVDRLSVKRYDLIVCDYNLGQGADGQQFLELVRRKRILPLDTAFLMVTGETGYEQVSTAAEYSPDDYLLKPFTTEQLAARIARILDKKTAMQPIHRWLGAKPERDKALAACDALIGENNRYQLDALRLKGELLLELGRAEEARALYAGILAQRATPWATVGHGRALLALGRDDEARAQLEQSLAAYPNYLAAYDSLAQILAQTDKAAAQEVMEQALKVSPSTQRNRELGGLALANGDFTRAESAFKRVVDKDRSGFFKSHDDYSSLAKSCVEQGKSTEALAAIKDMAGAFVRSPELAARQAALECQVHSRVGNADAAKAALDKALALQREHKLEPGAALDVAQACFAAGQPDDAKAIIQYIAEDNAESDSVLARAQTVFAAAGLQDEGSAFLETTKQRMIKLNNDAVALAKAGELTQAIAMLTEAADRLTNNAQIALNAALALLMSIHRNGVDEADLARARRYIEQAEKLNPDHPKLAEVLAFQKKIAPDAGPEKAGG